MRQKQQNKNFSSVGSLNSEIVPIVSICCITYNHEKFIRECLDSFLMQKTTFSFEILIHDDASTDNTSNIIREYESKHPQIIKPIYQSENQYSKKTKINATYNYPRVNSKYIALCEGDDCWNCEYKLQKQVNLLESNSNISVCYHNALTVYEDNQTFTKLYCNEQATTITTIEDILKANYIPTCSVMMRSEVVKKLPDWFISLPIGDWPLWVLAAERGNIYYISDVMSIYRHHGAGMWASLSGIDRHKKTIQTRQVFFKHFSNNHDFQKIIQEDAVRDFLVIARVHESTGNAFQAEYFKNSAKLCLTDKFAEIDLGDLKVPDSNKINLHIIAYSQETLANVQGGFLLLDNLQNLRPDWMEYWPIRKYLVENTLDDDCLYGFFSPKFSSKTGLTHSAVVNFITSTDGDTDVFTFSPQPDMGAFFLNVFEQNDTFDSGFKALAQELFNHIGLNVDLNGMIMDSRHAVYSNYFVARKKFWLEWFVICEKLFNICEKHDTALGEQLCTPTKYDFVTQRKVFLMERVAPLLLKTGKWKIKPYNTFSCAWSGLPTNRFKDEVVLSDALKLAYNEVGHPEYMKGFAEVRNKVFFGKK